MKLDISLLRYLGGDEFRMLHAVEQGVSEVYIEDNVILFCFLNEV